MADVMSRAESLLAGFADIASSWAPSQVDTGGGQAATTARSASGTSATLERIRTAMAASPARSPTRVAAATRPPTSPPISAGGSYEVRDGVFPFLFFPPFLFFLSFLSPSSLSECMMPYKNTSRVLRQACMTASTRCFFATAVLRFSSPPAITVGRSPLTERAHPLPSLLNSSVLLFVVSAWAG